MISREGLIFCGLTYFYLVRLYGPVVVLPDRPFDTDEDVASVSFERSTYDECVEKNLKVPTFEEEAKLLPASRYRCIAVYTYQGCCFGVQSSYAALCCQPPFFNGNSYYSD